jgi:hypothetical protein
MEIADSSAALETKLHGVTSKKTVILISGAMRTSNLIYIWENITPKTVKIISITRQIPLIFQVCVPLLKIKNPDTRWIFVTSVIQWQQK